MFNYHQLHFCSPTDGLFWNIGNVAAVECCMKIFVISFFLKLGPPQFMVPYGFFAQRWPVVYYFNTEY